MGLKVIIVAAALGLIATSGHAFAAAPQSRDGLNKSGLVVTVRKANTLRVQPPKAPPASPSY